MSRRRWWRWGAMAVVALAAAACGQDPALLAVELAGPAAADPLVFHGNCLAGWSVHTTLQVRETTGTEAWIDGVTYRLRDEGHGEEIVAESLDRTSIDERFGTGLVPARGFRLLRLAGPYGKRPVGPITVSGEMVGRDEQGNSVRASFHLEASTLVVKEAETGDGGACSVP